MGILAISSRACPGPSVWPICIVWYRAVSNSERIGGGGGGAEQACITVLGDMLLLLRTVEVLCSFGQTHTFYSRITWHL